MDKGQLAHLLIGEQSSEAFLAALIFGLIGLLASLFVQLIKSHRKIADTGGFSLIRWLQDNYARIILSFLIILVGAAKGELVSQHFGDWGCLGLGFMTDKAIEALLKIKTNFKFSLPNKKDE